jgi:hypothetical protein
MVKVARCPAFKFGDPNDGALPGHPLHDRGLANAAVAEALRSSWIAELARQDRAGFADSGLAARGVRHFLLPFRESTLEVLGGGLDVSASGDPSSVIGDRMRPWLLGDESSPTRSGDPN